MTANRRHTVEIIEALNAIVDELKSRDLGELAAENLVPLANVIKNIGAFGAAVHSQIELRAIANGISIPGAAVKDGTVHRKWHDEETAEQLARETFGDAAFTVSLKSPAQIEKMDGGKTFVAVAAFKPDAPKKVVY